MDPHEEKEQLYKKILAEFSLLNTDIHRKWYVESFKGNNVFLQTPQHGLIAWGKDLDWKSELITHRMNYNYGWVLAKFPS